MGLFHSCWLEVSSVALRASLATLENLCWIAYLARRGLAVQNGTVSRRRLLRLPWRFCSQEKRGFEIQSVNESLIGLPNKSFRQSLKYRCHDRLRLSRAMRSNSRGFQRESVALRASHQSRLVVFSFSPPSWQLAMQSAGRHVEQVRAAMRVFAT